MQQLNENAATESLLSFIFKLLGVGFAQTIEPFDLSKWEVDSFDILGRRDIKIYCGQLPRQVTDQGDL